MILNWKISGTLIMIAFVSLSAKSCFNTKDSNAKVVTEEKVESNTKEQSDATQEKTKEIVGEAIAEKKSADNNSITEIVSDKNLPVEETSTVQVSLIAEGFYYLVIPGAQEIDENGNLVDNRFVRRFIILETESKEAPKVETVLAGNKKFTGRVVPLQAENGKILAGQKFLNDKNIYLTKKKNTSVWRIDMIAEGAKETKEKPLPPMQLSYTQNGKKFKLLIITQQQLVSPLYP